MAVSADKQTSAVLLQLFRALFHTHLHPFCTDLHPFHTPFTRPPQVYIPEVNWLLLICTIIVVGVFETSTKIGNGEHSPPRWMPCLTLALLSSGGGVAAQSGWTEQAVAPCGGRRT